MLTAKPKKKRRPSKVKQKRRSAWVTRAAKLDGSAVTAYALAVMAGDEVVGPWVRLACERHLRDLGEGGARGLTFDRVAAEHVLAFFPRFLRLAEGQFEGQPFTLQPWQEFILGSLFGWLQADGARRFRTAYVEVGKGAGKSPMAAGVGLYGLLFDGEASAEIYSAATTREQARILFTDARKMIAASPELAPAVRVGVGNIAQIGGYSFFRPVSSEHRGLDGKRVHVSLIDELHEHPTDLVVEKMRAGMKGRRQPIQFEITNAGHDRTSVCWRHHEYSTRLLEGVVDNDEWLAYVAALDEDDDPFEDRSCWRKANPNLGVSIPESYLAGQVREALGMAAKAAIVRRLNFCQWTKTITRALDVAAWDRCPRIDEAELEGAPCFAGLDLGMSSDFSAFVMIWILEDGRYAVRARHWLPEAAVEVQTARPYAAWLAEGRIEITSGSVTDYDVIEDAVRVSCLQYGVRECAYDRRFAQQLAHHVEAAGVVMVDCPQGFQLNEATVRLQELVAEKRLVHDGDPVLAWMASNLVTRTGRYGEIRPDKDAAPDKVDGIVALIMGLQRAIVEPEVVSAYEDHGLLSV